MIDYLIVGAGLSGAAAARLLTDAGKKVVVVEKNQHVGGNCHTTLRDGVVVHEHGPHIFHTSNAKIEAFVKRFANWLPYRHKVVAMSHYRLHSMPFNMATYNVIADSGFTVSNAKKYMEHYGRGKYPNPKNLYEEGVNLVGSYVFEMLIRDYTEKQWGAKCEDLPVGIISRLPVRFTYDDNYYYDSFQGVPEGGYTAMIEKMLEGIEVHIGYDYPFPKRQTGWEQLRYGKVSFIEYLSNTKIIYTGKVDELWGYELGELPYRSLRFETYVDEDADYGCAQVNFCGDEPYTRITSHKYFENKLDAPNWVSKEFPMPYKRGDHAYYPINNEANNKLWREYKNLTKERRPDILLLGRLAEYKYFDMDKAIHSAMNLVEKELKNDNHI